MRFHAPTKRRLIQLYSALLYDAHLKGFITGEIYKGKLKAVCVPGFNCYSCPGAVGACPLGSLQASLASSNKQAGYYILGIFLLYGLIAGRTICGFFCPLGLIQELLHKIPTPKIRKNRVTRALSYLKYVFLLVFVVSVTLWYGLKYSMAVPGFCKYVCPAGTFEGAIGLLSNPNNANYFGMLGIYFTRKFIIMLIIGLLCIFCYRSFCRFICPLGALYGLFNRISLLGVKVDLDRCNGCGACVRNCKMDVRRVGDHECIYCGQCVDRCAQGALSIKVGSFTLKAPEKGCADDTEAKVQKRKKAEKTVWTGAIILLAAVLLWVNCFDPAGKKDSASKKNNTAGPVIQSSLSGGDGTSEDKEVESGTEATGDTSKPYGSSAPTGFNVGDQLEDFTAECYDGSTFHLADQRGKVVIINLWATWCGPCVQELPHFNEFYHRHQDDAVVLACHSSNAPEDVQEFLSRKGWDMPFTIDSEENGIFEKTNGSNVLPQTIVLNRRGEVTYNEIRAITPEELEQLYEKAAEEVPAAGQAEQELSQDSDGGASQETAEASAQESTEDEVVSGVPETDPAGDKGSEDGAENKNILSGAPSGHDLGDTLPDFTITCVDGTEFNLGDKKGKPVILVFWGTFSEGSMDYLDVVDDLAESHKDVSILAVCYNSSKKDPAQIGKERGWSIPIAIDDDNETVFRLSGASMAVPRTVILDAEGHIVFNKRGPLTAEDLVKVLPELSS